MSIKVGTISNRELMKKVRKPTPKTGSAFKDKKTYSRKKKHQTVVDDPGVSFFHLFIVKKVKF
jgi:hypothetical protein